jgi:hypothetical protein
MTPPMTPPTTPKHPPKTRLLNPRGTQTGQDRLFATLEYDLIPFALSRTVMPSRPLQILLKSGLRRWQILEQKIGHRPGAFLVEMGAIPLEEFLAKPAAYWLP